MLYGDPPADTVGGDGETWTTGLAPNDIPGSWQLPNAAWLGGVPRDIEALRDRLYDDTSGHGRSLCPKRILVHGCYRLGFLT